MQISEGRWLLLIHQTPPKPDYFRVKIWRRLQRLGAVAIKNSVYVLPKNEQTQEDFQWVLGEIVQGGGEATRQAGACGCLRSGAGRRKIRRGRNSSSFGRRGHRSESPGQTRARQRCTHSHETHPSQIESLREEVPWQIGLYRQSVRQ